MFLSRRAARTHLVASRRPKYFLRLHSAGSASPGSGRPVRRAAARLRPGGSPQTLQTPPRGGRPVLRIRSDGSLRFPRPPAPGEALPPPFGYGPRLGPVRLDFYQQGTWPARRALRGRLTSHARSSGDYRLGVPPRPRPVTDRRGDRGISPFSRMEFPRMPRFTDRAGP